MFIFYVNFDQLVIYLMINVYEWKCSNGMFTI